jgi:hypothetical protein
VGIRALGHRQDHDDVVSPSELEKSPVHRGNSIILFYFVDTRKEKRNTAVSILRGLIWTLIEAREDLMEHLLSNFIYQRENLFSQTSIEALWRIFVTMVKDRRAGRVYCLVDGVDECQEDSLRPLIIKLTRFFKEEQTNMELLTAGNLNPRHPVQFASLKMILFSREAPQCLLGNLGSFARIQADAAIKGESKTGSASKMEGRGATTAATPSRSTAQKTTRTVPKLSMIAKLALEKKRLDAAALIPSPTHAIKATSTSQDEQGQRDSSDAVLQRSVATLSLTDHSANPSPRAMEDSKRSAEELTHH